jgi:hypothetical protein
MSLDQMLEVLRRSPTASLHGLEGQIWARIDSARDARRMSSALLPVRAACVIAALGVGLAGGTFTAVAAARRAGGNLGLLGGRTPGALDPAGRRSLMLKITRGLILTVILAFLAGAAGAWIGSCGLLPTRRPVSLHEMVHHELKLSADQDRQLDVLEQDFSVRRKAREAELRAANAQLAAAIQERHEYSPEVQAAVERFHAAMGAPATGNRPARSGDA